MLGMLGIENPILYSTATVSEAEFMDFLHAVGPQIGKMSHDKLFQEHGDVYHIYRNGGRSTLYIRFQEVARQLREQKGYVAEQIADKARVKREYIGDAYPGDAHLDEMIAREEQDLAFIEQRIAKATQFLQAEPKTTVLVALDGEKDEERHEAQQMMLEFLIKFAERFPQGVVEHKAIENAKLWSIEELVRLHEAQADLYEFSKEEVLANPWHDYYRKLVCTVNIKVTTSAVISEAEWSTFLDELDEHMGVGDWDGKTVDIRLKGALEENEFAQYIEVNRPANGRDFSRKMHLLEPIERLFGHRPETALGMSLTYHRDEEPDTRIIVTLACAMAERYPNVVVADPDPERIIRIRYGSSPMVRGADIIPWRLYSTEELLALHKQGKGLDTYWSPTAPKSIAS